MSAPVDVRTAEVLVVGGGVVGLAAASALLDAGADVRCLERAEPGSGQSAGYVRVFRHVHDRADLVELIRGARDEWDGWSARAGTPLIGPEGVLYAAPDAADIAALFASAGIEHRWAGPEEQRELLPIVAPPAERALVDVRGGGIRVRPTIGALVSWLGDRLVREEALAVRPDGDGALVPTPQGVWRADRVLVCAGTGTPVLAEPLGVRSQAEAHLHLRATFAPRPAHRDRSLACLLDRTGVHGATVYSGPVPELDGFAVGLATEDPGMRGDLARSLARVRHYVERGLPGLVPEPIALRPCWLTVLPWHADAFVARQAGPVVVFEGHNLFKFAPTLGRLLADAAQTGRMTAPLSPPP
jgi:sarcosine oxidase